MKRRPFIVSCLALLSLPMTAHVHAQNTPGSLLSLLRQLYPDSAAHTMIAMQIRKSATENHATDPSQLESWLQKRLGITADTPANQVKASISESTKTDFRNGRTMAVNGWQLSELEVFLCLALADH